MRKLLPLSLLIFTLSARSQEKDSYYVFDSNWKGTKIETARYLLHVHEVNDTCWQWDYYNFTGPLIKTLKFRDKDGQILHGESHYYNAAGWVDSIGTYRMGKKQGDFYRLSEDSFHFQAKYFYRDDTLIVSIPLDKQKVDTIDLKGKSLGISDFVIVEQESEYPGGSPQWLRYMGKHIKYPDRAVNLMIQGEVRVGFIVGLDGSVSGGYIARSVEFSLDEESLRIVRESGKWIPAKMGGRVIKSYKVQPVVYKLQ